MKKRYIFIRNKFHSRLNKIILILIRLILLILVGMLIYGILSEFAKLTTTETEAAVTVQPYYSLQRTFETTWNTNSIIVEPTVEDTTEETTEIITEQTTETTTIIPTESTASAPQPQLINLGEFRISHYCPCSICNGGYTTTKLGTQTTPYRTLAVDKTIIPLGSKVMIDGEIYIAEDTGGAIKGNRIDLCVSNHSEAYAKGVRYANVYLVK